MLKDDLEKIIEQEFKISPLRGIPVFGNPWHKWIVKLAQAILDAGFIKIKPFEWMERWLKAYDKANNTNYAKKIMHWINSQSMCQG